MTTTTSSMLRRRVRRLPKPTRLMLHGELRQACRAARRKRPCSRVEFAERCVVIPEGKHEGSLWNRKFQPASYWVLHLMDTLGFRRFAVTGCVQSGKTLSAVVIPTLWHLAERRESVIFLVPELTLAEKKWTEEIKPVIDASPELRRRLYGDVRRTSPPKGKGSRAGFSNTIRFANNTRLEFMGSTGSDARRSSSTAPVVVKTEVDRSDTAGEKSREASAAQTTEDRAESYGDDAWIYEECTVTTTAGRIYKQTRAGTDHWLWYQCPQCGAAIRPKRQHLVGVEGCADVKQARREARFVCEAGGCEIDNTARKRMQQRAVAVSRTQRVVFGGDGSATLEGELPPVEVLSFSYNAFDNAFWPLPRLGMKEWTALYGDDLDEEDLQAKQKRWTEPAVATQLDVSRITNKTLIERSVADLPRMRVPDGTKWLTCGADFRETQLHLVVRAWRLENAKLHGHAVDIAWIPVEREKLGLHDATLEALRSLRDRRLFAGLYADSAGNTYSPSWTLIDARYKERWIWEFMVECRQMGFRNIAPILGFGQSDPGNPGAYHHPDGPDPPGPNQRVVWVGDECHLRSSRRYGPAFLEAGCPDPPIYLSANVDEGKAFIRDGYNAPVDGNGSLTTFSATTADERETLDDYRKQVRAEREQEVYIKGKGVRRKFLNESKRTNHYFDCDNYSCFAVQLCGAPVSLGFRRPVVAPATVGDIASAQMPDGRDYLDASVY